MNVPSLLRRAPAPALRPFVEELWASTEEAGADAAKSHRRTVPPRRLEHVLPTGAMHVVLRLSDAPVRILRPGGGSGEWQTLRHGIVGGARSTFYLREPGAPSAAVGAVLRPGVAPLLFGAGAHELAERHTPLGDLLGARATRLRERLGEAIDPAACLQVLESFLAAHLPLVRGMDPMVARWLQLAAPAAGVGAAVRASGLSHRQFIANFRRAFGLAPKAWQRVRRFQQALRALHAAPAASLAELALQAGYSDQPHLQREFLAMSGITPGEYRRAAPSQMNHLPVGAAARPAGQVRSRRCRWDAPD